MSEMPVIQWYPGHIAKYERELKDKLGLVDVVVEVLDARLPEMTTNHRLEAQIMTKPTVLVLNKSDLADSAVTKRWIGRFKSKYPVVMLYETKSNKHQQALIRAILVAAEPKMKQLEAKGLRRRSVRVLVAGMPNVGKSSIINHLVGKRKTKTGHKAGVTRTHQWVRIHPDVELLDSPGIIPPALDSDAMGNLLAIVSSVGEAAFDDEEVGKFLLARIESLYPNLLRTAYKIPDGVATDLLGIAIGRNFIAHGSQHDTLRAAQTLLSEFRQGRLGRLTLEWPTNDRSEPPAPLEEAT